jgi:hypothetical protein
VFRLPEKVLAAAESDLEPHILRGGLKILARIDARARRDGQPRQQRLHQRLLMWRELPALPAAEQFFGMRARVRG